MVSVKILIPLVAQTLVLIGALNWGFIGFFRTDLVALLFRAYSRYIYMFVGVAAVYLIAGRFLG